MPDSDPTENTVAKQQHVEQHTVVYQYPGYQLYVAPHMPPVQQSQPASKPALPRKKNLLNIVNPNTQESIFVGGSSEAKGAPSTESVVDKKEASPVPVVPVPQPISESSRTSSDDIRCQFSQTVADRFKEASLLAETDKAAIVTEKNDNAIENQQQPVKTLKEEVSVERNSARIRIERIGRIEKVKKEIRGLLNKITPSTYAELSLEFINKKVWQDAETLPTVVELIFTKAVKRPHFVDLYADLCKAQHEAENKNPRNSKFYQAVVRKCQNIFEGTVETPTQVSIRKIKEQLESEEDPKEKQFLKKEVDELNFKQKLYMLGTIKFISHLYRVKFFNWRIFRFFIIKLLKTAEESLNDLDVEYYINLLETVGSFMEANERVNLNTFIVSLLNFKDEVSERVKFMIIHLNVSRRLLNEQLLRQSIERKKIVADRIEKQSIRFRR